MYVFFFFPQLILNIYCCVSAPSALWQHWLRRWLFMSGSKSTLSCSSGTPLAATQKSQVRILLKWKWFIASDNKSRHHSLSSHVLVESSGWKRCCGFVVWSSDDKRYDAFVMGYKSHADSGLSAEDRRWLENVLEEKFGYRLCLVERDIQPGEGNSGNNNLHNIHRCMSKWICGWLQL